MKILIIAVSCIMLLSGAAFAGDAYVRGPIKRDGATDPYYRTIPGQPRNDNSATQGKANPSSGKQEKKGPDPYDSRYNSQYNRPRY